MQFLRLPSNAAAAACRSRQRPRASSARFPFATRRAAGLLQSGGSANGKGGLDPSRRDPRATTVRLSARLLPGRPRGIGKFAETVCRLRCAPIATESATWRTVPCAVHLPARCDTIAAWHVGRGVPRPGPGFPRQTPDYSSAPGFPDYRVSPAKAVSLRRRRITSTRPGCPELPGGPGEAVIGRHQHGIHSTPVISASPPPRV